MSQSPTLKVISPNIFICFFIGPQCVEDRSSNKVGSQFGDCASFVFQLQNGPFRSLRNITVVLLGVRNRVLGGRATVNEAWPCLGAETAEERVNYRAGENNEGDRVRAELDLALTPPPAVWPETG